MTRKPKSVRQAVIFLRVSTDEQTRSGLGLEAQEAACRAWATANDYAVMGVYADAGVSGAADIEDSPELVAALAAVPRGGAFLVAALDRLGRQTARTFAVQYQIERSGARLVSVLGEGTADDSETAEVERFLHAWKASAERRAIIRRTKAALAAKKARGERLGGDPLGYRTAADGTITTDPEELATVARARELRASGLSLRAVAEALTAEGRQTKRGGRWQANTVRKVCAPRYLETVAA